MNKKERVSYILTQGGTEGELDILERLLAEYGKRLNFCGVADLGKMEGREETQERAKVVMTEAWKLKGLK